MTRLGHASPAAALRYQHATAERDQALAARMDALIVPRRVPEAPVLRVVAGDVLSRLCQLVLWAIAAAAH